MLVSSRAIASALSKVCDVAGLGWAGRCGVMIISVRSSSEDGTGEICRYMLKSFDVGEDSDGECWIACKVIRG